MRITCVTCLACLLVASVAFAAERPIFDAPRISDIVIDGRADDWGDRGVRLEPLVLNPLE